MGLNHVQKFVFARTLVEIRKQAVVATCTFQLLQDVVQPILGTIIYEERTRDSINFCFHLHIVGDIVKSYTKPELGHRNHLILFLHWIPICSGSLSSAGMDL